MKLIKATTEEQITLEGVTVNLQQVDGNIEAIVVTDSNGKYIRIVKEGTYSENLKVLIEEPVEYITVFDVKIKQMDGGIAHYTFNTQEEVDSKVLYCDEENVKVTKRLVEKVKNLVGQDVTNTDDPDGIPF